MRTKVIGGIKGETLVLILIDIDIFNEYTKKIKDFISEDYNPLDINDDIFNTKYVNFKDSSKESERKICAVITQTFDENEITLYKFKVLDNFDSIIEIPYIVVELEKNIIFYLNYLKKKSVKKNIQPIVALLNWIDSLKSRIKETLEKYNL